MTRLQPLLLLCMLCHLSFAQDDDGGDGNEGGSSGPKPCVLTAKDGTVFNLANAKKAEKDFTDSTAGGFTYQFQICGNTKKVCNKQPAPASKWRGGKCNNLGDLDTQTIEAIDPANPLKGVRIKYNEGDICKKQQDGQTQIETRAVSYEITCDSSKTATVLKEIKEINMCEYTIMFESAAACPASGGGGSGKMFLILLLAATAVYCGGGIAYNKYRAQKQGMEMIPQLEFWQQLPGLVKDGVAFSWANTKAGIEWAKEKYAARKG